jgi:protein AaeX
MPREIDVLGIYFPALMAAFLIMLPVFWVIDGLLARTGCYRWVWHIDIFRLSLFLLLFCSLGIRWYL